MSPGPENLGERGCLLLTPEAVGGGVEGSTSPDGWLVSVKASMVGGWGMEIPQGIEWSPALPFLPTRLSMHCLL